MARLGLRLVALACASMLLGCITITHKRPVQQMCLERCIEGCDTDPSRLESCVSGCKNVCSSVDGPSAQQLVDEASTVTPRILTCPSPASRS